MRRKKGRWKWHIFFPGSVGAGKKRKSESAESKIFISHFPVSEPAHGGTVKANPVLCKRTPVCFLIRSHLRSGVRRSICFFLIAITRECDLLSGEGACGAASEPYNSQYPEEEPHARPSKSLRGARSFTSPRRAWQDGWLHWRVARAFGSSRRRAAVV